MIFMLLNNLTLHKGCEYYIQQLDYFIQSQV